LPIKLKAFKGSGIIAKERILIAENDIDLAYLVKEYLSFDGMFLNNIFIIIKLK